MKSDLSDENGKGSMKVFQNEGYLFRCPARIQYFHPLKIT